MVYVQTSTNALWAIISATEMQIVLIVAIKFTVNAKLVMMAMVINAMTLMNVEKESTIARVNFVKPHYRRIYKF